MSHFRHPCALLTCQARLSQCQPARFWNNISCLWHRNKGKEGTCAMRRVAAVLISVHAIRLQAVDVHMFPGLVTPEQHPNDGLPFPSVRWCAALQSILISLSSGTACSARDSCRRNLHAYLAYFWLGRVRTETCRSSSRTCGHACPSGVGQGIK